MTLTRKTHLVFELTCKEEISQPVWMLIWRSVFFYQLLFQTLLSAVELSCRYRKFANLFFREPSIFEKNIYFKVILYNKFKCTILPLVSEIKSGPVVRGTSYFCSHVDVSFINYVYFNNYFTKKEAAWLEKTCKTIF